MLHGELPWKGSNGGQLRDEMKSKQLQFKEGLDKDLIDLLQQMLIVNNDKRIGWKKILEHPALA